jgi:protease-4
MAENMQATYDTFVEKAAQGRNTTPERIDAIGQGRVWTGRQAKEIGLVDELGGLERAVALAKQRAKIAQDAEVELVIYPPRKSFYDLLREPFAVDRTSTLASLLGFGNPKIMQALAAPLQVFRRGEPLALMPNVFVR